MNPYESPRYAADAGLPTLGICLGHQLAASALGGVSKRNPRGQQVGLPVAPAAPLILMMCGLQGSGKTTTCGKLGLWLRKHKKKNPLLVAADLQRPAAVDQLQSLGKQLGLAVYAVIMSLVAAFYYIRVIKVMYFDAPITATTVAAPLDVRVVLTVNGALVLLLGILPGGLMSLCAQAIMKTLGT